MTIINNVHGEPIFFNIEEVSIPTKFVEELFYRFGYDTSTNNGVQGGCEYQNETPISFEAWIITELPFQTEIQENILNLWKQSTDSFKN